MFKNILLPTDGSKLSEKAVQRGIELATSLGDSSARATMLGNLALVYLLWDEPSLAFEAAAAAIGMYRRMAGDPHLPWVLGLAAVASATAGTTQAATELLAECVDRALEVKAPVITADALESAIPVVGSLHRPGLAARLHGAAIAALGGDALDKSWIAITKPALDSARAALGSEAVDAETAQGQRSEPLDVLADLKATLAGLHRE